MKNMNTISKKITSSVVAVAFVAISLLAAPAAHAQSIDLSGAAKDNNSNAVIYGGVNNIKEIQSKYAASASVQQIYTHFGITSAGISGMDSNAVVGSVTKTGNVLVGNN